MNGENSLGRVYKDRECIIRKGEESHCMFVVLKGELEVLGGESGKEVALALLGPGDIFGEMALFEKETRSATVRAKGDARVMTLDKRTLLKRIAEDPLVALNLIEMLCRRIRKLNTDYAAVSAQPEMR